MAKKNLSLDAGKSWTPKLRTKPLGLGDVPSIHGTNSPTAQKQQAAEESRITRQRGTGASREPRNGRK